MEYLKWNDLLVNFFFNSSMSGREVLLYVNEDVINTIGEPHGADTADFIQSVKSGLEWTKAPKICQRAYEVYKDWRKRDLEYPPYVGYLIFFVLASVTEIDRASHSYYPRLNKLLGEDENAGMPPGFDIMYVLWDDLEKWSREDKHEELGRFVARIRGGWINVGIPWSQTLLSENERKTLPSIFDAASLDPTDPPSPEIIPKILSYYGQAYLERRTRNLLDNKRNENNVLKFALIELVLDELEEWDGTVEEPQARDATSLEHTRTSLRLCIKLDSLASSVKVYVRFKTGRLFPEEAFNFKRGSTEKTWNCIESRQGWSTPLKNINANPPEMLDGALLNWSDGEKLIDDRLKWRAGLPPSDSRLFSLGIDGLPDWVETRRLERRMVFLLSCKSSLAEKVKKWGEEACEVFEERNVSGLSHGWMLFYGKNAFQSCDGIDILTLSTTVRLQLKDGIKVGRGNAYFKFAPPKIVLENSSGTETVLADSIELEQPDTNFPVFVLPENIQPGLPIRIEVDLGDRRLSKVIRLEEFELPGSFDETPCRDKDGNICTAEEFLAYVRGAHTFGDITTTPYESPNITCLSDKIIFVGDNPGQVSHWPDDPYPSAWNPVWAISKLNRKQWEIHFCGTHSQLKSPPTKAPAQGNKADIKKWKEAIWYNRKKYILPEIQKLQEIWNDYLKLAKNVK